MAYGDGYFGTATKTLPQLRHRPFGRPEKAGHIRLRVPLSDTADDHHSPPAHVEIPRVLPLPAVRGIASRGVSLTKRWCGSLQRVRGDAMIGLTLGKCA
jgi:hypothetical protein